MRKVAATFALVLTIGAIATAAFGSTGTGQAGAYYYANVQTLQTACRC